MADVFLSYAHADRQKAGELAQVLAASGWTVFWDRAIRSGPRFRDVIARELESAKCVVVLWSPSSVQSDWVIDEAEEARTSGKLVPAVLETAKPPHGFRGLQTANLVSWTSGTADAEFDLFIGGIEAHAPREPSTERGTTSTPPEPPAEPTALSMLTAPASAALEPAPVTEIDEEPSPSSVTQENYERGDSPGDELSRLTHDPVPQMIERPAPPSPQPAPIEAANAPPIQLRSLSDTTPVDTGTTTRTDGRDTRVLAMAVGALLLAGVIAVAILRNEIVPDDLGFDPTGVVMTTPITLSHSRYQSGPDVTKGFESLLEQVRSVPGVRAAAAVDADPTQESRIDSTVAIGSGAPVPAIATRVVGDYFTVLRIPLLAGRAFYTADQGLPVAVVSKSLKADSFNIGHPATVNIEGSSAAGPQTINGLVDDVRSREAERTSRRPRIYIPEGARRMTVLVRLDGPEPSMALKEALSGFDSSAITPQLTSMETAVRSAMSQPRFGEQVIKLLSLSAAILAVLAIFWLRLYFRGHIPAV